MLFTEEVNNINELLDKLDSLKLDIEDNVKVAVVCFIFDENNRLILQRRGAGARDDVGKLCAIGGSANFSDPNFRASLMREMKEEGGEEAEVRIDSFLGAVEKKSYDKNAGVFSEWIILGYKGTLLSGEIINTEPERCAGFVTDFVENFKDEELNETAKVFMKDFKNA